MKVLANFEDNHKIPSNSSLDVLLDGGFVLKNKPKTAFILGKSSDGTYLTSDLSNVGSIPYSDSVRTRSHIIRFKAGSTAMVVSNQEVSINVVMKQTV